MSEAHIRTLAKRKTHNVAIGVVPESAASSSSAERSAKQRKTHNETTFRDALNLFRSIELEMCGSRGKIVPLLINGTELEITETATADKYLRNFGIVPMSGLTTFVSLEKTFEELTSTENWNAWRDSGGNNRTMLRIVPEKLKDVIATLRECGLINENLCKILHSYLGNECELYSVMRIEPEEKKAEVRDQKIHVDHMDVSGKEVSVAFSMRRHENGVVQLLPLGTMYFAGTHRLSRDARSAIMNTNTRCHNIEVSSGEHRANACVAARYMETGRQCVNENIQCGLRDDIKQEIKDTSLSEKEPMSVCIMNDCAMIMEANGVHAGQGRYWKGEMPPTFESVREPSNWENFQVGDNRMFLTFRRKDWDVKDGQIGEGNNNWPMMAAKFRPCIVESENGVCDLVFRTSSS